MHLAISDSSGRTLGGHLIDGNLVYNNAEIVITASTKLQFTRQTDASTGWKELEVIEKKDD